MFKRWWNHENRRGTWEVKNTPIELKHTFVRRGFCFTFKSNRRKNTNAQFIQVDIKSLNNPVVKSTAKITAILPCDKSLKKCDSVLIEKLFDDSLF